MKAKRKELNIKLAKGYKEKSRDPGKLKIDYIQRIVCGYFNIPVEMIQSDTRKREIVQVRQISMFFAKGRSGQSLATIGNEIGKKDHATVLHACKTVNNLIDSDKRFKAQIEELEKRFELININH